MKFAGYLSTGKTFRNATIWHCSGVILNQRFILTAAHCKILTKKVFLVRLGVHTLEGGKDKNKSGNI